MQEKTKRNKKIARLRNSNPVKWTYAELGRKFSTARSNIIRIVRQEEKRSESIVKDEAM